jgi:hypothetical protein
MGSELVKPHHLDRRAVIYVRQSSPQQVLNNQESLRLQYALRQRARDLGWREADIEVVDADLGLRGASATHRQGFKDLVARIALGEVGLIVRSRSPPGLIAACAARGWDYRLRLKRSLHVFVPGQAASVRVGDLAQQQPYLSGVELTVTGRVRTNIGVIHDPGHDESWIVAMSAKPGCLTTLDYARCWGIEPMFSDFKSRGFGLDDTQIRYPDRLARLVLVMALALCCAVSTGLWGRAVQRCEIASILSRSLMPARPAR